MCKPSPCILNIQYLRFLWIIFFFMDYFEWRKIPRETGHFSEKAVVNFERDLPFDAK